MFTCIKCEHKYGYEDGDAEERMCFDCLETEEQIDSIIQRMIDEKRGK